MRLNDLPFPVFGDVDFRGKCALESVEQVTFFNRLRAQYPDTWGALAIHARNEQQLRGGQFGSMAKQKAEGMVSGASDIIIPARVTLVIELKRRDRTKSAWQAGQVTYLTAAHQAGAFACVALGCDAAWEAFNQWRKLGVDPMRGCA
jgi:hypothetical protein